MKETVETGREKSALISGGIIPAAGSIPVLRPRLPSGEQILPYLRRIDEARLYSNWGPLERELEGRIAEHFGLAPGAVRCASSGTQALAGSILGLAGRAGSDRPLAIVPAYTFVATALAAEECGYEPFIADIDAETLLLDPSRLLDLPELSQVGLVVPVGPYGRPVPQQPWIEFSSKTGIPVVIDDAASFDMLNKDPDRYLGELPVALSFHATKAFGCGEGGGVICKDERLASRIGRALNFGFRNSRNCAASSMNGKMSEYHAAVGLAEMDGWNNKLASFQKVGKAYRRRLREVGLEERFLVTPEISAAYAVFKCRDAAESLHIQQELTRNAIEFRLWYGGGLTDHTHLANCGRSLLPITEELAPRYLGLPWAIDLDEEAMDRIVSVLHNAILG